MRRRLRASMRFRPVCQWEERDKSRDQKAIADLIGVDDGRWRFLRRAVPANETGSLISKAEAIIGRPITPISYAGVARRTTRRAYGYGAAGVYGAPVLWRARRVWGSRGRADVLPGCQRLRSGVHTVPITGFGTVAGMNAVILTTVCRTFRRVKSGAPYVDEDLNMLLAGRGLLARLFRPMFRMISAKLAHVPARLPVRPGLRHGDRGVACSASPPTARQRPWLIYIFSIGL